jgi:hypothetical protein
METQAVKRMDVQSSDELPTISTAETSPATAAVASRGVTAAVCPTCASGQADPQHLSPQCVYVIGNIVPRYPTPAIEKEAWQATARTGGSKDTDRETMARVLRDPNNKYLVRHLCWVLSVHGVETYIVVPRDGDFQPLIDAYRSEPNPGDLDVVIGVRGPIANPETCNGLLVPILIFEKIYSFSRKPFLESIPKQKDADAKKFAVAAGEMFDRIMQQSDNAGATDGDRAKNYISMRYDQFYTLGAEQLASNASLTSIDVLPSPLSGTRNIVEVVFSFTNRTTDVVSKYFTRVDVTECFPFLVTKMSPYYDR